MSSLLPLSSRERGLGGEVSPVVCGAGPAGPDGVVREWTVATFVVHRGRVLLLYHRKLGLWLPPGGHVEPGELPDEAAVREVLEETGVHCRLVGERGVQVEYPRQLIRPYGVQVEQIRPGVEHIDLVYFAVAEDDGWAIPDELAARDRAGWYAPADLAALGANDEIQQWVAKVVQATGVTT
jgi:ADP-ribose pyrophosphatase YjhB (NUDIX family)